MREESQAPGCAEIYLYVLLYLHNFKKLFLCNFWTTRKEYNKNSVYPSPSLNGYQQMASFISNYCPPPLGDFKAKPRDHMSSRNKYVCLLELQVYFVHN